jgi:copper resistance protein B
MDRARKALADESRFTALAVRIDQLESRVVNGGDGFAWDGEARVRGEIDRFVIASEGEGEFGHGAAQAELRGVWRHAVDPWWNLELGVRRNFRRDPERTYALVGIQGLGPYCLEIDAQMFVSNKRDLHVRSGLGYDRRITQRLILEPEA